MSRRRRTQPRTIDAQYVDVSDGQGSSGNVGPLQRYDPSLHQPRLPSILSALGHSLAERLSPVVREDRAQDLAIMRIHNKGERLHTEKAMDSFLRRQDIENEKDERLAAMEATKQIVQQEAHDRRENELVEYMEERELESKRKEVDANQAIIDSIKMERQLEEVDELGLSPLVAELTKRNIRKAWKDTNGESDHHSQRKSARETA